MAPIACRAQVYNVSDDHMSVMIHISDDRWAVLQLVVRDGADRLMTAYQIHIHISDDR